MGSQQATIVMPQEIIGIEVDGRIIVSHRSSEIILIIACQSTVDVVAWVLRQQVNTLGEELLTVFPFLTGQTDHCPFCPNAPIIGIKFKTLTE